MNPVLSVVVVILGGRSYLVRCLNNLSHQTEISGIEILVPCDETLSDVAVLRQEFPAVEFIELSGRRTYAEMRAAGFQRSHGTIVALTEDHCIPAFDWCARILEEHRKPYAVVGGAVDKAIGTTPDTVLNWAIYLYDFSRYANPVLEGSVHYLTDCNVSYKRSALNSISQIWQREFHETSVHWALLARAESLWLSPRIVVHQQRSIRWKDAVCERYRFGRLFASTRVAETSNSKRILFATFSFLLPFLQVLRIANNLIRKRRYLGQFFFSLPAIIFLSIIWAAGEFVGYVSGRPSGT